MSTFHEVLNSILHYHNIIIVYCLLDLMYHLEKLGTDNQYFLPFKFCIFLWIRCIHWRKLVLENQYFLPFKFCSSYLIHSFFYGLVSQGLGSCLRQQVVEESTGHMCFKHVMQFLYESIQRNSICGIAKSNPSNYIFFQLLLIR